MIIVRCPSLSPPNGAQKCKTAFFPLKSQFAWRKSATKFLCVKTVRAFIGLTIYPCNNYWWESSPSTWNFGSNWQRWSEIADFRSIFARSASGVTSSENFQLSLIGSPLRGFQWAQDEHRASPKGWLKTRLSIQYTSRRWQKGSRSMP